MTTGDDEGMPGIDLPGFAGMAGAAVVQRLPLFRTLGFDETRRLFAIARREARQTGEVVIEENALGVALYIIEHGEVVVTRGGRELGRCSDGELLGEMSLCDDVLTSSRVVATRATSLFVIERRAFDALLEDDARLAAKVYKAFCRTLADRLRRANSHVPEAEALDAGVL